MPNAEDYLLIDMPGQVELYTHYKHVNDIAKTLQRAGYIVCSVYLVDSRFLIDPATFISASLMAMSCQINLELTHFTLLSKMDIVKRDRLVRGRDLDSYLQPDTIFLTAQLQLNREVSAKFRGLNDAIAEVLSDYSLVRMLPFSKDDPELMEDTLMQIDSGIQFGEEAEPRNVDEDEGGPDDDYVAADMGDPNDY